jgi:soluble lytic murein transglycosylase
MLEMQCLQGFQLNMKFLPAVLLAAFALISQSAAAATDDQFLAAQDAARAGDRAKLERIAPELRGHDLEHYVEYWRLMLDINNADATAVRAFLSRYAGSYLAEKLRGEWAKQLGKTEQWTDFDAEYAQLAQPDQELVCYALRRRAAANDATMLDAATPLWLSLLEPPDACYPVLEALIVNKRVLADGVWERIRRQFEAGKMAAARYTMNYLPERQTPDAKVAAAVIDKPLPWLVKLPANFGASRMNRELAALAVSRVARADPYMAAEQLSRIEPQLQSGEAGWAWTQIGFQGAYKHLPEALDWYRKAGDAPLSDEAAQWKVRAALRAQDWGAVRATIEKMPPALAAEPAWTYWLGRAYRAGGRVEEANAIFARVAGTPTFYGNLADEELGRTISTPPRAAAPTAEETARVQARFGIQTSLALFRVGMRSEGVREWNWALRDMSDRELLAASDLAQRAGVYDRAIAAADRTKSEHDYSLRYLSPYSEHVRPAARRESLDDAWIYGLMRQESRFVTNAKSTVGASGLMQLMPATARWVAKKLGLKDFRQGQINDMQTNVLLGTTYMRLVLERLDNQPVLASAAYNAGPGRAQKWRASQPLEGAVYAETIPFSETRDYVKKVMSNSVYYGSLFNGEPQSLKSRLGTVLPRGAGDSKGDELP